MFGRRWILAVGVAAVVLAGCSGSESSTAYCEEASELASLESLLSPDSVRNPDEVRVAFETFGESLSDIEQNAPSEIEADIGELGKAVDEIITSLDAVDFDLTQLDVEAAGNLLDPFGRPQVRSALERVNAYDTLNCNRRAAPSTPTAVAQTNGSQTDGEPEPTVPPPPTPDPTIAMAAEFGDLIRTTSTDEQIEDMLAYAEVSGVDELVDALVDGDVTIDELDIFLARTADGVPFAFGDDAELDILWNACASGDWLACDGLFMSSPLNSLYQRFADTCGQTLDEPTSGQCVAEFES